MNLTFGLVHEIAMELNQYVAGKILVVCYPSWNLLFTKDYKSSMENKKKLKKERKKKDINRD